MLEISDNDNIAIPLAFRKFNTLEIPDNDILVRLSPWHLEILSCWKSQTMIYSMAVPLAFRNAMLFC